MKTGQKRTNGPPISSEADEKLRRMVYREFLAERGLYEEAGLKMLPQQLGEALVTDPDEAIYLLASSTFVRALSDVQLKKLFAIRDMALISRTAASVSAELKQPGIGYEQCIRTALCYAVVDMDAHVFAALRAAASIKPEWAQHHFLYGLLLARSGNVQRALSELNMALEHEPYEDARIRIRTAIDLIEGRPVDLIEGRTNGSRS